MAKTTLTIGKDYGNRKKRHNITQDNTSVTQDNTTLERKFNKIIPQPEEKEERSYKRFNMGFTDSNYEAVISHCNESGLSNANFINGLIQDSSTAEIDSYIASQPIRRGQFVDRRRGKPMKRINLRIAAANYEKLVSQSDKHGLTISQYLNKIIEAYTVTHDNTI